MKCHLFLFVMVMVLGLWLCPGLSADVTDSLAKNRAELARTQAQAAVLEDNDALDADLQARLSILQEKISVLKHNRDGLLELLPPEKQAEEFMKDLVYKPQPQTPAPEPAPVSKMAPALLPALSTDKLHEKALALAADEKFAEAAEIYEEIVLTDPEDDQAYLLMGHNYLLSGSTQKAQNAFENAIHIDPANQAEILPFYENLVLQNPEEELMRVYLGYAHLMMGNRLKAKDAFREALSINPESFEAVRGLRILEAQGDS
jgi:tetratricopeptide (TPR) repeat protein